MFALLDHGAAAAGAIDRDAGEVFQGANSWIAESLAKRLGVRAAFVTEVDGRVGAAVVCRGPTANELRSAESSNPSNSRRDCSTLVVAARAWSAKVCDSASVVAITAL